MKPLLKGIFNYLANKENQSFKLNKITKIAPNLHFFNCMICIINTI